MTPIPDFPTFRRLAPEDREPIEAITRRFPASSDFCFTGMCAWDTDDSAHIARLHGNLVARLKDYQRDEHFLTFLGQDRVAATVRALLAHARQEGLAPYLKLVPEMAVAADPRLTAAFAVAEDRDNFDYLYAAEDWARFPGSGFRDHRKEVSRCRRGGAIQFRPLDLGSAPVRQDILALFQRWAHQKAAVVADDHRYERAALERACALGSDGRISALGAYDGARMAGFSIWEGLPDGLVAVAHFQKAAPGYPGLWLWLAQEMGRRLTAAGYRQINAEQDLGIPGLRDFKLSLRPRRLLKKYVVAEKHPGR